MIRLVDISFPFRDAVAATMATSPLMAPDAGCCAKTWMADKPGIQCRPWRQYASKDRMRVIGWRREAPTATPAAIVRDREIALTRGECMTLAGRFIAIRRASNDHGNGMIKVRDAAEGRNDAARAYEAWLRERLIDLMPHADVDAVTIDGSSRHRVLRKYRHRSAVAVRREEVPVVDATIRVTVRNAAAVEAWLLTGVGPQKAFGYGAFLPAPDATGDAS